MDTTRWLIKDFCALVDLPDSEYVYRGGPIAIDNTVFLLAHDTGGDPDQFFVQADFGPPPAEREATVYYELLKRNFMLAANGGGSFTISPANGHVVFLVRFDARRATPQELVQAMAELADQAREWRETRFLAHPDYPAPQQRARAEY